VIVAGAGNWGKVEPILRDRYYMLEYTRLWWPMQDYFGLTWDRVWGAISSPGYRAALWDMWFDRDYTAYGVMVGHDFALRNWDPSEKMRLNVRKDVAATIWQYGIAPTALEPVTFEDPYVTGMVALEADAIVGQEGTEPGQFSHPRGLSAAQDGSIFVADTSNHRIQHLTGTGEVISVWGSFADLSAGEAPGGTFNEPWDVAVAPDGTVYVADTWNHRIQHFTQDGQFLGMFGHFGQADSPDAFWGPRAVVVDASGRIFVSDTGNKRIVIFDAQGNPLSEVGTGGVGLGELDEPVGLAIDNAGHLYVDDTWNQRVQVFEETEPNQFIATTEWSIDGWFGQSLENKPYLGHGPSDQICTSDPESYRILCFTGEGKFLYGWGEFGQEDTQFSLPVGVTLDGACGAWVTDSAANRVMKFTLPDCQ
jgi:NHL repeat